MSFSELDRVVSSAQRSENIFVHFEGSFINVKSIGPRIEPFGNPLCILIMELDIFL
jgi:hypothetical protein